jgi:hypothetical protein
MALTYSIQVIGHHFIQPRNPRNDTEHDLSSLLSSVSFRGYFLVYPFYQLAEKVSGEGNRT